MDYLKIGRRLYQSRAGGPLLDALAWLTRRDRLRHGLVRLADRKLEALGKPRGAAHSAPGRIERERLLLARAILSTVDRLAARRALAPDLVRRVTELWGRALLFPPAVTEAGQRFRKEKGCGPPWFLTISPGHACNLACTGCYADASSGRGALPWHLLERVVLEARRLWGIPLVVVSGGEPLAYRSEGRDVLHLAEENPDTLFLMFTNGTLIDRGTPERLARIGNLTPAVSVEGLRDQTDTRRGNGVFEHALGAMAELRRVGVPFGVSVTLSRSNWQEVLSDEFLDFFFQEQGAFYGFLFHYMPIGRNADLARMPTPAERVACWRRTWEVIERKRVFLFDFWNHGPLAEGCLAAGREGGYLYIDWAGRVMPCVFAPYSAGDLHTLYERNGTLNDIWEAPFFRTIRQWQREYGYGRGAPTRHGNWLRPCPMRDHHPRFHSWLQDYRPEPADEAAKAAFADEQFIRAMAAYGEALEQECREIWETDYLGVGFPPGPESGR